MIITEQKSFDEIIQELHGDKRIFLIGCGMCATSCQTGGEKEIDEMEDKLKSQGLDITGKIVINEVCVEEEVRKELRKHLSSVHNADSILLLTCGVGVQVVADLTKKKVHPGLNGLFIGVRHGGGKFDRRCALCGDCMLDFTSGICPVTRCSKSLLNGPCGGAINGKCEINEDKDCAWLLIYKRLLEKGMLPNLKRLILPKDHSKSYRRHRFEVPKQRLSELKKKKAKI